MRQSKMVIVGLSLAGLCAAGPAGAYEYTLQFTPNPGARGLVVAGYGFNGNTVTGNCSYYITSGGGGRGGGHPTTTYYNQTCTWDLYGNLLGIAQGAPTAPTPLSTTGGLIVYARNAQGDTTGIDTNTGQSPFVNTPSAQYVWLTQPAYVFLPDQKPKNLALLVQSVGDFPLVVSSIDPTTMLAKTLVRSTTCQPAPVPPGRVCRIIVTYDPSKLPRGDDPYTAYDVLTVGIVSNAGQEPAFSESIEVPVRPGG